SGTDFDYGRGIYAPFCRLTGKRMMKNIQDLILKNRYTLLVTVLIAYVLVLVIEGAVTGREARVLDFENPFFDLNIRDFEQFREYRD
ncbi:MAG: hypothetical protein RLP02_17890, partial [Coleofasciculus sp. C2-GNP5-27]